MAPQARFPSPADARARDGRGDHHVRSGDRRLHAAGAALRLSGRSGYRLIPSRCLTARRRVMSEAWSSILESPTPTLIATGGPTEGPLWHPEGYLTYVRHRESLLMRWDPNGEVR